MPSNIFNLPNLGKPIEPADAGVYCSINRKTGDVNNLFNLVFEDDDWYLFQLKNTSKEGDISWVILADNSEYMLKTCHTTEVKHHFDQPEFAEPKGAWQLMRNARYGFGKFTPLYADENSLFAMIIFSQDAKTTIEIDGKMLEIPNMLVPLLIQKTQDKALQALGELGR